jgi:hypothetical protein
LGIDSLEEIWNCINLQFRSSHVPIFMLGTLQYYRMSAFALWFGFWRCHRNCSPV